MKLKALLIVPMMWLAIAVHARASETIKYVYTDTQGTPLVTSDAQGNIVESADYSPYAKQVLGAPSDATGYTGHVTDQDSGLVYMQARYYDPESGRFISTDPHGGFNRYVYAANNPINFSDPTGMDDCNLNCMKMRAKSSASDLGIPVSQSSAPNYALAEKAVSAANTSLTAAGVIGHAYMSPDNLVQDWGAAVSSVTAKYQVELGSDIGEVGSGGSARYYSSLAYSTGEFGRITSSEVRNRPGVYGKVIGFTHSHPTDVGFSGATAWAKWGGESAHNYGDNGTGDLVYAFNNKINAYVTLPNGSSYGWRYVDFVNASSKSGYASLGDTVYLIRSGQ